MTRRLPKGLDVPPRVDGRSKRVFSSPTILRKPSGFGRLPYTHSTLREFISFRLPTSYGHYGVIPRLGRFNTNLISALDYGPQANFPGPKSPEPVSDSRRGEAVARVHKKYLAGAHRRGTPSPPQLRPAECRPFLLLLACPRIGRTSFARMFQDRSCPCICWVTSCGGAIPTYPSAAS